MKPTRMLLMPLLAFSLWRCSSVSDTLDFDVIEKSQTRYYFNAESGNDGNDGATPETPFKSLYMLQYANLKPGDSVFLAGGVSHRGAIVLKNISGTKEHPIVITSYGEPGSLGHIDARGNLAGVLLQNCNHIKIKGIRVTATGAGGLGDSEARTAGMRCGILCQLTAAGNYSGITIEDTLVEDIYYEEEGFNRPKGDDEGLYGYGMRIIDDHESATLTDVLVDNCTVQRVSRTGILFTGDTGTLNLRDVEIRNTTVDNIGGPGIQVSNGTRIHIHHTTINKSGSTADSRNYRRGSGFWCFHTEQVLFEYNRMTNAFGPADSAGAHIDYNCKDVIYQYNFSANNWGGFIEILGNNYNCCYRYNVSVNDGQRVKGVNGDSQDGHTLWLSKYSGLQIGPFNSYIYNNTIYVASNKLSCITIEGMADGVYIANNIFHVLGRSIDKVSKSTNSFMEHNLFASASSWAPKNLVDSDPIYGDPQFAKAGGLNLEDYIPQNRELVKDKGGRF